MLAFDFGTKKFVKHSNKTLKSIDYSILYTAVSKNAKLLTFDKKLEREFVTFMSQ